MPVDPQNCGRCSGVIDIQTRQSCKANRCRHQPVCINCLTRHYYLCQPCARHHGLTSHPPCNLGGLHQRCRSECGHEQCAEDDCNRCISYDNHHCTTCLDNGALYCTMHCTHGSDRSSRPQFVKNPIKFWPGRKPTCKKTSRRYIAAEIETAGVARAKYLNQSISQWSASIVSDGSLSENGFEINTSPASMEKYEEQVKSITKALADGNGRVDSKCGLHVHVDSRELDFFDMRRLMGLWAIFENAMFKMVDRSRDGNRYCLRTGPRYGQTALMPIKTVRRNIFFTLYGVEPSREQSVNSFKSHKYNSARYAALNLHSWLHRGTIENRMHHGTIKAEDIINWGYINAALVDMSLSIHDRKVDELLTSGLSSGDVKKLLLENIPESTHSWVLPKLGDQDLTFKALVRPKSELLSVAAEAEEVDNATMQDEYDEAEETPF